MGADPTISGYGHPDQPSERIREEFSSKEGRIMVRITTNMPALMAWRQSGETRDKGSLSMERLTKDLRICADDARVKPDVSEKMRDRIRGHNQAICDLQQGILLLQTAAGGLDEIQSHLQNMRELLHPVPDETRTETDQNSTQQLISGYIQEIDRIAANTQFAGKYLLDGSNIENNYIAAMGSMDSEALGVSNINISYPTPNNQALLQFDAAFDRVAFERDRLMEGAKQLEQSMGTLLTASENLNASESLIREPGTALESLNIARTQIRLDSNQALLAQGNLQQQRTSHLLINTDS